MNCLQNLDNKWKALLNAIEVIPSLNTTPTPSGEESEGVRPMNVVTQAQAQNNPMENKETQAERSSRNTWSTKTETNNGSILQNPRGKC